MNGRLAILHVTKKAHADIGHLRQLNLRSALPLPLLLNDYGNLGHGIYFHTTLKFYQIKNKHVNPLGLILCNLALFDHKSTRTG